MLHQAARGDELGQRAGPRLRSAVGHRAV